MIADPRLLRLECIIPSSEAITLVLTATAPQTCCPGCGQRAGRVHSRYERQVADLPWNGLPVRLRLHTRRFFCDQPDCPRRVFTERLPGVVARYARKTERLTAALRWLGYALGGEAGARLAVVLGFAVSPDTLLRHLRTRRRAAPTKVRVLGVDDWAFRRGHRYGTLLVDLEAGGPIGLLADRQAKTLAGWLKEHPEVEVLSRDRGGTYAQGAREGAPQAVQVADRFHLLRNMVEALEACLARHGRFLRQAAQAPAGPEPSPFHGQTGPPPLPEGPTPERAPPLGPGGREAQRAARRAQRQALYETVHRLFREGYDMEAIAEKVGVCHHTVRRYLRHAVFPERQRGPGRPNVTRPWRAYLEQRWREGCHNGAQLFRELVAQGFTGSSDAVGRCLRPWRAKLPPEQRQTCGRKPRSPTPERVPSSRTVAWWLLGDRAARTQEERDFLARLEQQCPVVLRAHALVAEFFQIVRERKEPALTPWLQRVEGSGVPELQGRAVRLRQDEDAVRAALCLPWSNGPVEGQVNRLKLIKRQGYGRAHIDLLEARLLPMT